MIVIMNIMIILLKKKIINKTKLTNLLFLVIRNLI
jgi:hypothetical protein